MVSKNKKNSGSDAKERLKLVLYSEHQGLQPETIEKIKLDLIDVMKKYIEVDVDNIDIKVSPDGALTGTRGPGIQANIPIKGKLSD